MVVDRSKLKSELLDFYNFRGKNVLYVGAGGNQLLQPKSGAAGVVAIDSNAKSLDGFRKEAKTRWKGIPVEFIPKPFEETTTSGSLVYFEFCLHEMKDPEAALDHAHSLAPEVLVMDHLPKSPWMFFAGEEEDAQRSATAMEAFGIRRRQEFTAMQKFDDYEQLETRMSDGGGPGALKRISPLKGSKGIEIQMDYGLYLL